MAQPDSSEPAESYDVVILGFEPRAEPAALGLQRVFGVDHAAADALLRELPKTVRRGVNRPRAEYFRRALVSIGAQVEIRNALAARTLVQGTSPPMAAQAVAKHAGTAARTELAPVLLLAEEPPADAAKPGSLPAQSLKPASRARSLDEDLPLLERWQLPEPGAPAASNQQSPISQRAIVSVPVPTSSRPRSGAAPSGRASAALGGGAALQAGDRTSPDKRSDRALAAVRGERSSSRASTAKAQGAARHAARSFWESVPEAVQFPWLGRGRAWLFSIGAWAFVTNLCVAYLNMPVLSGGLALLANAGLLALCADYHRRCMWSAVAEADALNQRPQLSSVRGYDFYLRSGAHIAGFALVSQLPIVAWLTHRTLHAGSAGAREVFGAPAFWLLAALPGMYWPMAIATASHANRFAGVWHVWIGLRVIGRAPLAYAATLGLGALSFALPWLACVIVGKVAGLPALYFAALAGVPLGMSHAVMGTLTGQLLRTRPEVFE